MAHCTSAEALADFASLITTMKQELGATSSPVVAFGGSYGGMLSSWFRIKYPNIIDGAIAASAPIWVRALASFPPRSPSCSTARLHSLLTSVQSVSSLGALLRRAPAWIARRGSR